MERRRRAGRVTQYPAGDGAEQHSAQRAVATGAGDEHVERAGLARDLTRRVARQQFRFDRDVVGKPADRIVELLAGVPLNVLACADIAPQASHRRRTVGRQVDDADDAEPRAGGTDDVDGAAERGVRLVRAVAGDADPPDAGIAGPVVLGDDRHRTRRGAQEAFAVLPGST